MNNRAKAQSDHLRITRALVRVCSSGVQFTQPRIADAYRKAQDVLNAGGTESALESAIMAWADSLDKEVQS